MSNYEHLAIQGAYGRDYVTKEELLADWRNGKDFKIKGGAYLSIRDVQTLKDKGISKLEAFYYKNVLVCTIKL